jgi:hypothetical protein
MCDGVKGSAEDCLKTIDRSFFMCDNRCTAISVVLDWCREMQ